MPNDANFEHGVDLLLMLNSTVYDLRLAWDPRREAKALRDVEYLTQRVGELRLNTSPEEYDAMHREAAKKLIAKWSETEDSVRGSDD